MVLDGLASSVLNRLLGDYVTSFDSSKVKFSLSGELTLHNLELKTSALDSLGLPIRVVAGTLSKLYLQVPWTRLGSQPAIIRIEGLYVLIGPAHYSKDDYSEETYEKSLQAAKQRKLALAESYKLARQQDTKDGSSGDSYIKRMLNSILSTLELHVSDVHIRYEDQGMQTSAFGAIHPPFALGAVIDKVIGISTDSQWNQSSTSSSSIEMLLYKLLNITGSSVYLDINEQSIIQSSFTDLNNTQNEVASTSLSPQTPSKQSQETDMRSPSKLNQSNFNRSTFVELMAKSSHTRCDGTSHHYILEPNEATFKLMLNKNEANFDYSQFQADILFSAVSLVLRDRQYESLFVLIKRFDAFNLSSQYIKWKPSKSVKDAPREWWDFAINSVLFDIRRRAEPWKPSNLDLRRARRKAYVPLYSKMIDKQSKPLQPSEKLQLEELERVLNFDDIIFFRCLAEIKLKRAKAQVRSVAESKSWGGWMASFVWSNPTESTIDQQPQQNIENESLWDGSDGKLSEEDWNALLDSIHFERSATSSVSNFKPPADYIKYRFSWTQAIGSILLKDSSNLPIASFSFHGLESLVHIKEKQTFFETSLSTIELNDLTSLGSHFPQTLYPQALAPNEKLLKLGITFNDKTSQTDVEANRTQAIPNWALDLSLKRLNMVINVPLTKSVLDFFLRPLGGREDTPASNEHEPTEKTWSSWIQSQRRNEQLLALASLKKSFRISVDIEAPNILIPQDCYISDSPLLVLVLGTFSIKTKLSAHQNGPSGSNVLPALTTPDTLDSYIKEINPTDSIMVDVSEYYDKYDLSITAAQVIITKTSRFLKLLSNQNHGQLCLDSTGKASVGGLADSSSTEQLPPAAPALSKYSYLIVPFDVQFSLAVCKINSESMPNVKVSGSLPALKFVLSSNKIQKLKALASTLMSQISQITSKPDQDSTQLKSSSIGSQPAPAFALSGSLYRSTYSLTTEAEFTRALAGTLDLEEPANQTPLGIGLSIEASAPEIEIVLVLHQKSLDQQLSKTETTGFLPTDSKSSESPFRELVSFKFTGLGYRLDTYPKSIHVNAFLKTFSVEDYSQLIKSPFRFLIESHVHTGIENSDISFLGFVDEIRNSTANKSLIHIDFTKIDTSHASYRGIEHTCNVKFNELAINLNQNSIRSIVSYISAVTQKSSSSLQSDQQKPPKLKSQKSQLGGSSSSINIKPKKLKVPKLPSGVSERIEFYLTTEITAIKLCFVEPDGRPLAECSLRNSKATFKAMSGNRYQLEGHLGNLKVTNTSTSSLDDPDPNQELSKFRHVISVRGAHVIDFKLTNIQEPSADESNLILTVPPTSSPSHTWLYVQINSMRILLNPKWIFSMILNVSDLISIFTTSESPSSKQPSVPVQPEPVQDPSNPTFFKYRVKILNPFIIVPQDCNSSAVLITDWGEIDVIQSIRKQDQEIFGGLQSIGSVRYVEDISIHLKNVNIQTGQIADISETISPSSDYVNARPVLTDTNILVVLSSTFIPFSTDPNSRSGRSTLIDIDTMKLFLSPEQIQLLCIIVKNNLYYEPSRSEMARQIKRALINEAFMLSKTTDGANSSLEETGRTKVHIGSVWIEAHDHYPLLPAREQRLIPVAPISLPKFVGIEINQTDINWTTFSDDSLRLSFRIGTFEMNDLRPSLQGKPCKTVIYNADNKEKAQIVGSLVTVPSKGQFTVSVTINELKCAAEASFLYLFWNNLSPLIMEDLMSVLSHREQIISKFFTPLQHEKWNQQKSHPEAGSSYSICLTKPEILLNDLGSADLDNNTIVRFTSLNAISCMVGIKVMKSLITYDLKFDNLAASLGEVFGPPNVENLFQNKFNDIHAYQTSYFYNVVNPFDIRVRMINLPEAEEFEIEVENLAKISLSYSDYKVLEELLKPFWETGPDEKQNANADNSPRDSRSHPTSSTEATHHQISAKSIITNTSNIPTISDQVSYKYVERDEPFSAFNTLNAPPTGNQSQANPLPPRPSDSFSETELVKKMKTSNALTPTIAIPNLSLGVGASIHSGQSTHIEAEQTESCPIFKRKKLILFPCKIQFVLMDNKEIDLGMLRLETSFDEFWLQDWGIHAFKQKLTPNQLSHWLSIPENRAIDLKANVNSTLSADCYNADLATWEPLVEPFHVVYGLSNQSLIVSSKKNLNVNITANFLSSYKRFTRVVETETRVNRGQSNQQNPKVRHQSAYYIRNYTGLPMKYRLYLDSANWQSEEKSLEVGEEAPIQIPAAPELSNQASAKSQQSRTTRISRSDLGPFQRNLMLSAKVHNFLNVPDILVDHTGCQVAHLGQNKLLIVETQYRLGSKLITLKSRISIHNNTKYPLIVGKEFDSASLDYTDAQMGNIRSAPSNLMDSTPMDTKSYNRSSMDVSRSHETKSMSISSRVSLDAPRRDVTARKRITIKKLATVEPFGLYHVPLDLVVGAVLHFKPGIGSDQIQDGSAPPIVSSQYSWSQMTCDLKNLIPTRPIFVECLPTVRSNDSASQESRPFEYSAGVSRIANKNAILAGADQLMIHFQPPILIENLLPTAFEFRVKSRRGDRQARSSQVISSDIIKPGQKLSIHHISSNHTVTIEIGGIPGFKWSPPVVIRQSEADGPMTYQRSTSETPNEDTSEVSKYLLLPDFDGRELRIQIDNRVDNLGTRIISLYTSFWIVNKSGLPLLARENLKNPASLGAGQQARYSKESLMSSKKSAQDIDIYGGNFNMYAGDLRDLFFYDLSAGTSQTAHLHDPATSLQDVGQENDNSSANSVTPGINDPTSPMMYCPNGFTNDRIHIKVADSHWSNPLILNSQNDSTVFGIDDTENPSSTQRRFELSMTITPGNNQFWKTRVVTFAPRYILINKTSHTLFIRQRSTSNIFTLLPGEHAPWHWPDGKKVTNYKFRIKLNAPRCTWSGGIDPSQLDIYTLKTYNSVTGLIYLTRVIAKINQETNITTITFKDEDNSAPLLRIDNYTNATLYARQKNINEAPESILPLQRRVWGWIEPVTGHAAVVEILFNTKDKIAQAYNLAKVKAYRPINFRTAEGRSVWLQAQVSTDKTTRVLSIRPIKNPQWDPPFLTREAQLAYNQKSHMEQKLPSPEQETGDIATESEPKLRLQLYLKEFSVSIINSDPMELLYGKMSKIFVEYINYDLKWSLEVQITDAQIDNQIPTTFFPVALYSNADSPPHWFRFSMIRSSEYTNIIYQPYVSLLLRETTIRIDERLLLKVLELVDSTLESMHDSSNSSLIRSNVDVMTLGDSEDASKMIYNHLYHINPIRLSFSFLSSKTFDDDKRVNQERELSLLNNAAYRPTYIGGDKEYSESQELKMSFVSGSNSSINRTNALLAIPDRLIPAVENAPISLNGLLLKHSFVSSEQLRGRIAQHYRSQLMGQVYTILGSFEALGNPVSLVSNLGTGVKDLFYEPAKGIAISPEEFGAGLSRGGKSFATKSIYALFNSTTKVLNAVGSGVAIMSLDDDYQAKRNQTKRRQQPTNVLTGFGHGLKEFGEGLFHGVTGIVTQPIKGYESEGVQGIAKGIGKGLIGVAVKPVVGTLDLVQRTTEGIKNTAAPAVQLNRSRPPRYIPEDGVIRQYDKLNSIAMDIVHSIENLSFSHEDYWGYFRIEKPKHEYANQLLLGVIMLVSSQRLTLVTRYLSIDSRSASSSSSAPIAPSHPKVTFNWTIKFQDIREIRKVAPQQGNNPSLEIVHRSEEGITITRSIPCKAGVQQLLELYEFISSHQKKWLTLAQYYHSINNKKNIKHNN